MEALYRLGKASAAEIREALPDPPTYTAVRTQLTILHERGDVKYQSDGIRYIYEPVVSRTEMAKSSLERLLQTFFDNSAERIVETLINREEAQISAEQLARMAHLIEVARKEGR